MIDLPLFLLNVKIIYPWIDKFGIGTKIIKDDIKHNVNTK